MGVCNRFSKTFVVYSRFFRISYNYLSKMLSYKMNLLLIFISLLFICYVVDGNGSNKSLNKTKKTKNFHKVKSELRTKRKHLHRNKKNNFAKRKKLKLKNNKIYKKHTKKRDLEINQCEFVNIYSALSSGRSQ